MTARPTPGASNNTWGQELNDWIDETIIAYFSGGTTSGLSLRTQSTDKLTISNQGVISIPDSTSVTDGNDRVTFSFQQTNPPVGDSLSTLQLNMTAKGTGVTGEGGRGLSVLLQDSGSVVNKTVTGAANNGSGLIRITCTSHTFSTGDRVAVYGVGGTTEANGNWTITVITANTFDLQGSAFANAYTAGGTATNRPYGNAIFVGLAPTLARGAGPLTGTAANADDFNAIAVQNGSATAKATDCYYVAASPLISGAAWSHAFSCDAKLEIAAVQFTADLTGAATEGTNAAMIDLGRATASGGGFSIRLPNQVPVAGRNAANTADVWMFYLDAADRVTFFPGVVFGATTHHGGDLNITAAAGMKIGLATSQKIGFYNTTPVIQPTTTGTSTGFTAGAGTTVTHLSTFTGNTGSAAYTIGDVVNALKKLGLMAA